MELSNSVFLITSKQDNRSFGTGFIIYQNTHTYLLTCAHVVRDVGGESHVIVDSYPAEVVAMGCHDGPNDLAVLKVKDIPRRPPLNLKPSGKTGCPFLLQGFQSLNINKKPYLTRPIKGCLGEKVELADRGQSIRVKAWDLIIDSDYKLQKETAVPL